MKKLALTSLLAMVAATGAHAANVIDGNPLYRPVKGNFYSVTSVDTHNQNTTKTGLNEELGYSFTDRLLARVSASGSQSDWFETSAWDDLSVGLDYRFLDADQWKADVYGSYTVNDIRGHNQVAFDKDNTWYAWTVGARFGFIDPCGWTLAAHAEFNYGNTESFNWDHSVPVSMKTLNMQHSLNVGVDGQVVLNREWALVGGVDYTAYLKNVLWDANLGHWTAKVGANYNMTETMYVGGFVGKEIAHTAAGEWKVQDGFTFGAQFGIDF